MTGVLTITLEKTCKVMDILLETDKEYVAVMKVHQDVSTEKLNTAFAEFQGEIYQVPPARAAVKRRIRIKKIHSIKLLQKKGKYVLFKVDCEAGTYIRKLCVDIGRILGVNSQMVTLRRTRSGVFSEAEAYKPYQVAFAYYMWRERGREDLIRKIVRPVEEALSFLPRIVIKDSAVDPVCHGAYIAVPGVSALSPEIKRGDTVLIQTLKGEAVAIAKANMSTEDIYRGRKGVAANPLKVLMKPGTYS